MSDCKTCGNKRNISGRKVNNSNLVNYFLHPETSKDIEPITQASKENEDSIPMPGQSRDSKTILENPFLGGNPV